MRWLLYIGLGAWRKDFPRLSHAVDTVYWTGALVTIPWLAFMDNHGVEGLTRILLIPADIMLAACWPLYWIGYLFV